MSKTKRNVFLTSNKYQDKIILLSFLPSVFIFLFFILIVMIGNPIITQAIYKNTFSQATQIILVFTGAIVFFICSTVFVSMAVSFVISHHIVGPFGRMVKELDDIIDGKSQRLIISRPGDDLAKDLLKRINVLADFYIKNKK